MTDAGLVNLDAEVVDVGIVQRVRDERLAVAEADVEHAAGVAAEQLREIQRTLRARRRRNAATARRTHAAARPSRGRAGARSCELCAGERAPRRGVSMRVLAESSRRGRAIVEPSTGAVQAARGEVGAGDGNRTHGSSLGS